MAYRGSFTLSNSEPNHLSEGQRGYLRRGQGYKVPLFHRPVELNTRTTRSTMPIITSMLVCPQLRSIYDPFNVRESILERPHTERLRHSAIERRIIRPVIPIICWLGFPLRNRRFKACTSARIVQYGVAFGNELLRYD